MNIAYPKGKRNPDGSWAIRPVHNILGWKMRCSFAETHHGYYTFVLVPVGWWLVSYDSTLSKVTGMILVAFGIWCFVDDWYDQHHKQVLQFNPLYHSFLHNQFARIYKYKFVQKLTAAADAIFGWLFGKDKVK